ncbi:hypothetical protein BU24DRAFT_454628 [Aaosphaeria arxii CBS 175.79]|uniref:ribonuclease Z n=1 Tax=Aaosphaeria arxii CBS 175.79 TaxID=1450172 RepID=A0A6A5XDE4_9PLEO|nr:uncharacterized protein BU24DRAFT_454628 [Aaosphaeria arxii CBS 175.79]KAF2011145.1 hypothetical protein BU24DRAFT_454628 [Aaosphaeria arxii CBS 175.79]
MKTQEVETVQEHLVEPEGNSKQIPVAASSQWSSRIRKPLLAPLPNITNPSKAKKKHRRGRRLLIGAGEMDTSLVVITTPTADTAGTTLMLQCPKRHYLFGSQAEGTQRAMTQMGARLMKAQEFFITGRTEWHNIGGLIGMTLTLADASTTSYETAMELYRKKGDVKGASAPPRPRLNVYGAPNLKHMLSTCRRFIFRKGLPITATEYKSAPASKDEKGDIPPTWQDDLINVWAMSIAPSEESQDVDSDLEGAIEAQKRLFDTQLNSFEDFQPVDGESVEQREKRYDDIRTDLLKQMFDSSWSFDTLVERHISEVEMPAAMYVRNPSTNKLENYHGPMPGGSEPLPDVKVLTRTPWPAAMVRALPPTKPSKESLSYIVRTHAARGKFDVKRAQELRVPRGQAYSKLTAGHSVQNEDGETITPDMVVGPDRPGQGAAILDVPSVDYIENLVQREELTSTSVMEGVQTVIWILGPGVSGHPILNDFIKKLDQVQHVISSGDESPNRIALDSVAAQTTRLAQIDGERYHIPVHDNFTVPQQKYCSNKGTQGGIPANAILAERGMKLRLMPKYELQRDGVPPLVDIQAVEKETPTEIIELAKAAHENIEKDKERLQAWRQLIAHPDTEVITLGTGSALPSKYRNVSATLVRVPGIGNYLLDCGENTIGQLQRVFKPDELVDVLRNLRMIWISHLHADHHLGTASLIKAWYTVAHKGVPTKTRPSAVNLVETASERGLAVISHDGMLQWLHEYSSVEDFGYSRILPLQITSVSAGNATGSKLHLSDYADPQTVQIVNRNDYESIFGFADIQATRVKHCHGAMAVSFTFPPESSSATVPPLKISYSGDCRPSDNFATIGRNTSVLIHEATFDDELRGDAIAKKHSTTSEALGIGAAMNATAVVLTHFSQRYQKIPVIETVQDDGESRRNATNRASGDTDGPMDVDEVAMDTTTTATPVQQQQHSASKEQIIKIRSNKNMKVAIAFDYMRVRIGDIAQLDKFNDALNKLLVSEEDEEDGGNAEQGKGMNGNGKKNGDGKEGGGKKKKMKRNN